MGAAIIASFANRARASSPGRMSLVAPAVIFLAGIVYTVMINRIVDARDSYVLITELCVWLLGWGLYLLAVSADVSSPSVVSASSPSRSWQDFWKRDAVIAEDSLS